MSKVIVVVRLVRSYLKSSFHVWIAEFTQMLIQDASQLQAEDTGLLRLGGCQFVKPHKVMCPLR